MNYFLKQPFCTLVLVGFLLTGCNTGKKALQQGNFETAVTLAVKRLQSKPNSKKARSVLSNAYDYAINFHTENASQLSASGDPLRYEKMIDSYRSINRLGQLIRRCPACMEAVPNPANFTSQINQHTGQAAETRYQMGLQSLINKQNRLHAKEAHLHFMRALDLSPNYKDSREKADEALMHATLRVVIEPIPAPTRQLAVRHEYFYNKLHEYFLRNPVNPYVQFVSPQELQVKGADWVDHVIKMEFDHFVLGNVLSHTTIEEVSRDSVVVATEGNRKIYGTVKAKLKTHEKSIIGSGLLDFQILDLESNKVISQDKFMNEYRWYLLWASFNGDERALSVEQLRLVKISEVPPPAPQFMFEQFAVPIYDQVMRKIQFYYRNF